MQPTAFEQLCGGLCAGWKEKLNAYIDENKRREYEIRKKLGG